MSTAQLSPSEDSNILWAPLPDSDDDSHDSIDGESNEVESDSAPDSDYSDSDL